MTPALGRLGSGLLSVGAVLGACCLVLIAIGPLMDVRPLLFRSDSMTPTIGTGDLAIARTVPAGDLTVGDIVSVPTSGGDRVTHRVVAIEEYDGGATLTLRGDGNESADAEPYAVSDADRVVFVVPWAGRVVAAVSGPWGLFVLGMVAAGLLALVIRGGPGGGRHDGPGGRRRGSRRAVRHGPRVAAASGAAMTLLVAGPASAAPWTDDVAVTETTLTTTTIPTTTLSCGALGVLSVTFNWTAVPNATNYTLHFGSGGSSTVTTSSTSRTITTALAGGTAWVTVNRAFGSTTWTSAPSNTRTYTVAVVSLCS